MSNLAGIIRHGVKMVPGDRCLSWLPFYHDMGLVGLVLVPVAAQASVDYLDTREFAMRPRQWLNLMTVTQATISFSPPFGYELCARRLRPGEAEKYDLSNWRVAGVGAEMIRSETLVRFAKALAPAGLQRKGVPGLLRYGGVFAGDQLLAAVPGPFDGLRRRRPPREHARGAADSSVGKSRAPRCFVECGSPLPEYEVEIRDEHGAQSVRPPQRNHFRARARA